MISYNRIKRISSIQPEILQKISTMGFVGVEFGQLHNENPRELRKMMDDLGLQYVATHLDALPKPKDMKAVLDFEEELGNKTIIIPYWNGVQLSSEPGVKKMVEEFNQAVPTIKEYGMRMGFHNHCEEFLFKFNGKTVHQLFMEQVDPSIFAEVDIYWAQTAGEDPATILRSLGKRAPFLHIKDGPCLPDQPMVAVGKGKVDIKGTLRDNSAEWHTLELDCCATDMFVAIEESYKFLTTNGLSKGKV